MWYSLAMKIYLAEKITASYDPSQLLGVYSTVELAKDACEGDAGGDLYCPWDETRYTSIYTTWESHPYIVSSGEVDVLIG